ncbi:nucleoside hydrolase [Ferrimonas balearica]|uniref:nucleoside hydrolase n=1 Tax=Ferrimonas balearica TaxID=44012 RepID=UPI001C9A0401|nr:nucleoside hydrolase [Ferrimonas balearica]MBY5923392.1 nucleoside hydrolase [Ferrimonas balearica]MBY5995142.1 nucleoside hydrolase [Ferrimonas balearica]
MAETIIFDTDPGIDDAMALLLAHAHPAIHLKAITTVYGNGTIEDCTRNACYLNQKFGMGAEVVKGAAGPLRRSPNGPTTVVHGEHAMGDVVAPADTPIDIDERPAYRYLCDTINEQPGEITLVAVGPLTNLALALQHDPDIAHKVKQVVVMGGAFGTRGHFGNVAPFAEANIHDDPDAADRVFTAPWRVTIVGLDATHEAFFSSDYLDALKADGGKAGAFIHDVSRFYLAFYSDKLGLDGCHVHDPSAVAYVIDPTLFTTRSGPVRVVCDGPAIGMTLQKIDPFCYADDEFSPHPAQSVCVAVDEPRLLTLYRDSILSLG